MTPAFFPEANTKFGPPPEFEESQIRTIPAHIGTIEQGSVEGTIFVVVAYQPSQQEKEDIMTGKPIFLSVMGGLPPHFLSTDFYTATHPA